MDIYQFIALVSVSFLAGVFVMVLVQYRPRARMKELERQVASLLDECTTKAKEATEKNNRIVGLKLDVERLEKQLQPMPKPKRKAKAKAKNASR